MPPLNDDFQPLFSADAVSDILRNEDAKHRMRRAAYGSILNRSKADLIKAMKEQPALIEQAPELLTWLLKYGQGEDSEAKLMKGAAIRLGIVLKELGRFPNVH